MRLMKLSDRTRFFGPRCSRSPCPCRPGPTCRGHRTFTLRPSPLRHRKGNCRRCQHACTCGSGERWAAATMPCRDCDCRTPAMLQTCSLLKVARMVLLASDAASANCAEAPVGAIETCMAMGADCEFGLFCRRRAIPRLRWRAPGGVVAAAVDRVVAAAEAAGFEYCWCRFRPPAGRPGSRAHDGGAFQSIRMLVAARPSYINPCFSPR